MPSARGLSTRDIEDLFIRTRWARWPVRARLLKSSVSEITDELWAEYEALLRRELVGQHPGYVQCWRDLVDCPDRAGRTVARDQHRIRTTNVIERAFEELRRRTKVIPRFFNERSCLKCSPSSATAAGTG